MGDPTNWEAGSLALQFSLLGFLFMLVSFVVMGGAGLAGGRVRRLLAASRRGARRVQLATGGRQPGS